MTKRTTNPESPSHGIVTTLRKHSTSTLSEVMGKRGYMSHEIKPITPDIKLAGPATTVFCHVGDNLTLHKAIEIAAPGDVLVVEAGGYKEAGGMWGEIMSFAAKARGIEGLVIDGAVRDVKAIKKLVAGFLKLLFPNLQLSTSEFLEYCVHPSVRLRQAVRYQLCKLDPEYKDYRILGEVS